jgi:formylglycine-generating enzyme required for sulfatase activity
LRSDRRGQPHWKTFHDWVDQYRKQLEDRRLLEILADKWEDARRPRLSNLLARGRQLGDFRRAGAAISRRAADYLDASRRLRSLRAGAVVALVALSLSAAYGSWWTAQRSPRVALGLVAMQVGWVGLVEPEMIELEDGTFSMGLPEGEGEPNESPQHDVTVPAFAIGRYEVTFEEYDAFAWHTGRPRPHDEGWGRGRRPVINVTWHDANAYVEWLGRVTGKEYRLPSEAEWEYAARAGTTTRYWWGDDEPTPEQANFGNNFLI